MSETPSGLALLRQPFAENQISLLPKPTNKDNQKGKCNECGGYHGLPAVHLRYVGHAALTDRLLDADPAWQWEPVALGPDGLPAFDKTGGLWIKLTVCGVTRLGYGHAATKAAAEVGSREKEVIGDALRNAAMRFGAALDLWHKGDLHLPEPKDDDVPAAREKWLADWLAAIDTAGTVGDLKRAYEMAVMQARNEGDTAAEARFTAARDAKAAKAKRPAAEKSAAWVAGAPATVDEETGAPF